MNRIIAPVAVIAIVAASVLAQGPTLVGSWPADGGMITVTSVGGAVNTGGLNFTSTNSGLIPISGEGSAAPFDFLLANNVDQVRLGNLLGEVSIDGALALSVGATSDAALAASWDRGSDAIAFDIGPESNGATDPGDANVPEPSGLWLLLSMMPLTLLLRRRRK